MLSFTYAQNIQMVVPSPYFQLNMKSVSERGLKARETCGMYMLKVDVSSHCYTEMLPSNEARDCLMLNETLGAKDKIEAGIIISLVATIFFFMLDCQKKWHQIQLLNNSVRIEQHGNSPKQI